MLRVFAAGLFAMAVTILAGCDNKPKQNEFKGGHDDHKHDEKTTRDITLPDGKLVHAILEAHLHEMEGNELDLVFEDHDKEASYPIPMNAKITARVTRAGIDKEETLEFTPGNKDERKGDPEGKCSRFSAEAKWMKPDDKLTVVVSIEYDGKLKKATYTDFVPKDAAHKHDHK
jgi:hypothetical protein